MFRVFGVAGAALVSAFSMGAHSEGSEGRVQRSLDLKVGQSAVLRGVRESCEGLSPGPVEAQTVHATGRVIVSSGRCGGRTSATHMLFMAERPGTEQIPLRDDLLYVTVRE
jgi:hypothetical protein